MRARSGGQIERGASGFPRTLHWLAMFLVVKNMPHYIARAGCARTLSPAATGTYFCGE